MTEKIKALYKRAINDTEFLAAIKSADGDRKPGLFASSEEKHFFVATYYGWLVGKYADEWESGSHKKWAAFHERKPVAGAKIMVRKPGEEGIASADVRFNGVFIRGFINPIDESLFEWIHAKGVNAK